MDTNLSQNVDTLFSNLQSFTQNEGLLGKPFTHGEKTFIPVVSLSLGYGSGSKASKNDQSSSQSQGISMGMGNMAGGALGLGAKLCTDAVIMVDDSNDNVSVIPVKAGANANQLMDKIPQLLSNMGQNKQQGQQQGQKQGQQQSQQQNQSLGSQ